MQIKDALLEAMDHSGLSRYAVAKKLGKQQNYVYVMLAKGTNPAYKTLQAVTDACNYNIVLRNRTDGHEIKLDPPKGE